MPEFLHHVAYTQHINILICFTQLYVRLRNTLLFQDDSHTVLFKIDLHTKIKKISLLCELQQLVSVTTILIYYLCKRHKFLHLI